MAEGQGAARARLASFEGLPLCHRSATRTPVVGSLELQLALELASTATEACQTELGLLVLRTPSEKAERSDFRHGTLAH